VSDDLKRLLDRQEIVDVTIRYCNALDLRDWELLASCFTDDAVFSAGPWGEHEGVEAIVGLCNSVFPGMDMTQHLVSNHVVEVSGDEATCTCDLVAEHLLRAAAGGDQTTTRAIYHDRLRRTADGWRFAHRSLDVTWQEGNVGIWAEALARGQTLS
jgi:ketosteroid isomerase-like protein